MQRGISVGAVGVRLERAWFPLPHSTHTSVAISNVNKFPAMIASAWPYAHQKVESGLLDAFTAQLREELATFPADVLVGAIKSLRRTCKFSPSIAELYEAADTLLDDKKMRLRVALDHLSEHQARAERKRLAALPWEEREAERWRREYGEHRQ